MSVFGESLPTNGEEYTRITVNNLEGKQASVTINDCESHYGDWPNSAAFTTTDEQTEVRELQVRGIIPHAVAGVIYRTGPANYKLKDDNGNEFKVNHWFDGFSQIYRFQLLPDDQGGSCRVLFNSRRQTDELVDHVRKTGKLDQLTFAQKRDPCTSLFQKTKSVFKSSSKPSDQPINPSMFNNEVTISASTTTVPSESGPRQTLVSRTDTSRIKTIDAETLEPVGIATQKSLHPKLNGDLSCAHAQFDPVTGDCYNFNLSFGPFGSYKVFHTCKATGETTILATISDAPPAYLHSLFLSENYVILCVWTAYFAGMGSRILWERNLLDAISEFDPTALTKWYVIDRKQGRGVVNIFHSPAMFAFHTVNAFEVKSGLGDSTDLYCDIVDYPSLEILHRLYYDNLVSTGPGVAEFADSKRRLLLRAGLSRFRLHDINNTHSTVQAREAERIIQLLSPTVGDLPTINPRYTTRKSRFVYTMVDRGLSSFVDGLAKTDMDTGEVWYWSVDRHTPGEAIFIPDPQGVAEDDGFLLSVVLNGERGSSYLLCLDARTMKEVGRAESDMVIGLGFHGQHMRSE